jgi:hypothetical protein
MLFPPVSGFLLLTCIYCLSFIPFIKESVSQSTTYQEMIKNYDILLSQKNEHYFYFNHHISYPFENERLKKIVLNKNKKIEVLMGSTYFSNTSLLYKSELLCLDMFYVNNNTFIIADGFGHYALRTDNQRIHRTTYNTIRSIADSIERLNSFEEIQKNILSIISVTANEISERHSDGIKKEEFGFLVVKIIKNDDSTYDVISVSVGDCAALLYDNQLKIL